MGKLYAANKKAYHDYRIVEELECGMVLIGNEVKSIKAGKCSIKEAWVAVENGELIIKQMHVTKWETANIYDVGEEAKDRKLLASKKQINDFAKEIKLQGYTLVPLKVYEVNGRVKVLIGLAQGKHSYDKRNDEKVKTMKRETARYTK